ncbi:SusD family protein [Pedobacter sp. ok626]|uniref:RagB/SusD family nutrient uptake outer membrane protein n=1 Tax=Pedobacter sp. ok626 TaxID=1761882 RepID=UPI00088BCF13|nr:RagB/SusD family nutrient uptake outer membrane protein [Pedobacter sp. ok626]SDK26123.1 SusD family protein [Pedobacter sp. ok626]
MKKIIFLLLTVAIFSGCKKIEETDHSTLTTNDVLESASSIDNLLYGAYSAIAHDETLSGYWKVFPELLADHVEINVTENLPNDPYVELFNRNMKAAQYEKSWSLAYRAIQNANLIIYAIDNKIITSEKDPEFYDTKRDAIKGEALFIRALTYFELVRFYGHQYGYNSTAPNSGVILRTKPVFNVTKPEEVIGQGRATVEEVYQSIISDLKAAELLLPPYQARRGKATTYVASAILARVYFQMNDYSNTILQVNKVIGPEAGKMERFGLYRNSKVYPAGITAADAATIALFPFNTTGAQASAPTETIFDFISATNSPINTAITRKYLYSTSVNPHLSISSQFLTDAQFTITPAAKVDGRYALITIVGTKRYTKKYNKVLENIPLIRSPELLLNRAEINAMKATTDAKAYADALADLTLVRERVNSGYAEAPVPISAVNILAEVQKERIRELAFEGDRLHNLRRMHKTVGTGTRALPWNSNKLLLKIPDAEIKTSTNIVQNPD